MKVKVINATETTAQVVVNNKHYIEKLIPNKYKNDELLVSIKDLHGLLEKDIEHKNWLVINKGQLKELGEVECDTAKKQYDAWLTPNNIHKYLNEEDYQVYKLLWGKAQLAHQEYVKNYKKGE